MARKKPTKVTEIINEAIASEENVNSCENEVEIEPMRYVYYFDNEITTESVQSLIDILCNYESVDLWFTTNGGSVSAMKVLIHFLNKHPDIHLYIANKLISAGTELLISCDKLIILTEDLDFVLFHKSDRGTNEQVRKSPISNKILVEQMEEENEVYLSKISPFLTKKEIKLFREGEDIVLYKKDFHKIKKPNIIHL